jgi:hypothetical protein
MMDAPRRSARRDPSESIKAKSIADEDPHEDDRKRQFYIFTHNLTRFYLSPRLGYANNEEWLRKRQIRFVVNVTNTRGDFEDQPFYEDLATGMHPSHAFFGTKVPIKTSIQYHQVGVEDVPSKNEAKKFERLIPGAIHWMHGASNAWTTRELEVYRNISEQSMQAGKKMFTNYGILVHCEEGRCRSPSVLLSYMMFHLGYDLLPAYQLLRAKVPGLLINPQFLIMLRNVEESWKGYPSSTLPILPKDVSYEQKMEEIRKGAERKKQERETKRRRSKAKIDGDDLVDQMKAVQLDDVEEKEEDEEYF